MLGVGVRKSRSIPAVASVRGVVEVERDVDIATWLAVLFCHRRQRTEDLSGVCSGTIWRGWKVGGVWACCNRRMRVEVNNEILNCHLSLGIY